MVQEKDLEKLHMSMVVSTKANGRTTKRMETEFSNTLMEQDMMESGKPTLDTDLVLISTRMEISMKVIGTTIFSKVWAPTITPMETFTRANGKTESPMDRVTIFTKVERLYTKETGKMERSKDSENW